MRYVERLALRVPEPQRAPYVAVVRESPGSSEFEVLSDRFMLQFRKTYVPGWFETVSDALARAGLKAPERHVIWPEYEAADFAAADLIVLDAPAYWVDELESSQTCALCRRPSAFFTPQPSNHRLNTSSPVLSINGDFLVFSERALAAIHAAHLTGVRAIPFGLPPYFALDPPSCLGNLIVHPAESRGFTGATCPGCGFPTFQLLFGPSRYSRASWSGDDLVTSNFDGLLVSPRAAKVISALSHDVEPLAPVFLE